MTDSPMMTQYSSTETVPGWDPETARRSALDTLHAEAWLTYQLALEDDGDRENWERSNILLKIAGAINSCAVFAASFAPKLTDRWAEDMKTRCAELAAKHFKDLPPSLMAARINLLRAHIRQTELLFCYENATEADRQRQQMLNVLSAAAYVAMWAEGDE